MLHRAVIWLAVLVALVLPTTAAESGVAAAARTVEVSIARDLSDGRGIVAAIGDRVVSLSANDGHVVHTFAVTAEGRQVGSVSATPDGRTVYFTVGEQCGPTPEIWRVSEATRPERLIVGGAGAVVSPDGRLLAYTAVSPSSVLRDCVEFMTTVVRDLKTGAERRLDVGDRLAATSPLAWSPDSTHLVVSRGAATLTLDVTRRRLRGAGQIDMPGNGYVFLSTGETITSIPGQTSTRVVAFDRRSGEVERTIAQLPASLSLHDAAGSSLLLLGPLAGSTDGWDLYRADLEDPQPVKLASNVQSAVWTSGTATDGTLTDSRWKLIPKDAAGLGSATSLYSLATTGDALLLGGARPDESEWRTAIWRSEDGVAWQATASPDLNGQVTALATDGSTALAIGSAGFDRELNGVTNFVWRSEDDGRTWATVADARDLLGSPEPQMGRPFVDGLLRHDEWWVASGGGSSGYAAIWVSRDGARWDQVLDSRASGSVSVVRGPDASLLAFAGASRWVTRDPTSWGEPGTVAVPSGLYLRSVATGGTTAVGERVERHGLPTPLLRSPDRSTTWTEDPTFLDAFPDASIWSIQRAAGRWVAAGTSGTPNHPDAWISTDGHRWQPLPEELRGTPGGTLELIAAISGRIVLMGGAPELDRYYVYDADLRRA